MEVKTHPLMEVIAKKLFGIETVPSTEKRKMITRAAKAAVKWHNSFIDDIAHEVWAVAQLQHNEGIEDGVNRIISTLKGK